MFENSVLIVIFGRKKDDLTGEWIGLHNLKLNDLYFLHNIVGVIKSRTKKWVAHVGGMGEEKCPQYFCV